MHTVSTLHPVNDAELLYAVQIAKQAVVRELIMADFAEAVSCSDTSAWIYATWRFTAVCTQLLDNL